MVKTRKEQLSTFGGEIGDVIEIATDGNFGFSTNNNEIQFIISGVFSGASVPGFFDPPYPIRTNRTIAEVTLMRRTAGSSGTTTVDILVNGNSVFDTTPKPSITFSDGDNAVDIVTAVDTGENSLMVGDFLDAELETVESGSAEGLIVLVRFA